MKACCKEKITPPQLPLTYLGFNVNKYVKGVHGEILKTLVEETVEDKIPCSWIRIIIIKIAVLAKVIYRCSTILVKIPIPFFTKAKGENFNIHIQAKKTLGRQTIPDKIKNYVRGLHI